ncbi:MAG: hypothetical protein HYY18_05785 [Planctomycetes bacterium]|nr:hypothetical protein [Planctomycetota bacterium]
MKRQLALFFAIALGASAEEPLLDAFTRSKLAEALGCVNLSVDDLGWNKRPIDDDFRLKCVNDTLDRPLELADYAARAEREFGADPRSAAAAGAAWLDVDGLGTADPEPFELDLKVEPESARALALEFAGTWRDAELYRAGATATLTPDEWAVVKKNGARLYLDESEEEWDMTETLAAAKKAELAGYFRAAIVLARGAQADRKAPADAADWKTAVLTVRETSDEGLKGLKISIGGSGNDVHEADIAIDVGGNDEYRNCRFVLDFGGDDTYRNCGEGNFACALIVDLAGNDRYLNANLAQGGAAFAASLLVDVAGDDRYEADQCSQGSGYFGVGMLFDLGGNDGYRGARFVQGFAGVRGLGVLSDVAGNDTYYAGGKYSHAPLLPENFQSLSQGFAFGLRGANTSGGVGILADHAGNDVYSAEVFGQGASYWFALGVLVDSAGHDKYDLYQYGQGAGIHLSSGVLFDRAGNDAYSCNYGVAQGCGHDWAAGLLLDLAGDDYYQGAGMTHGGANANGLGIIIDRRGDDAYSGSRPQVQGFSFQSRGSFGLGVLLDLGGKDRYSEEGRDNRTWTKSTLGVGLDCEEESR